MNDTLDEQIRVEVDLKPGSNWLRTILVLPEDIRKLPDGAPARHPVYKKPNRPKLRSD